MNIRRLVRVKKSQGYNLFTFMIVAFLAVVFFAGLMYAMGLINTVFHQAGVANDALPHPTYSYPCIDNQSNTCSGNYYVNMTQASDQIFGNMVQSIQALKLVALAYILAYAACIIITGALARTNPLWFFAYILISLLAVLFAPTIANAYERLVNSGIFAGQLNDFNSGSGWILLHLPMIVMVVALLGGIFMFINIVRTSGEGELK